MRAIYTVGLVAMLALVINAAPVQAQSFIATSGNDASACTRNAPCRSLQRGHDATPADGTLIVLDSGIFGSVLNINKSITISAVGVSAVLRGTADGPGALIIDNAGARVVLRGLLLTGAGIGKNGILINDAAAVHIEDCQIERFTNTGISLRNASTELFVSDSVSRDNGTYGLSADGLLTVDNSRFENNGNDGLHVGRFSRSTITRTVASRNGDNGIEIRGAGNVAWTTAADNGGNGFVATYQGQLTMEQSVARGNGNAGLSVAINGTARISNSVFTNNSVGIEQCGGDPNPCGTVLSRRNNTISGNNTGDSTTFTLLEGK